jgi:threonine/homoserine/homoserine lactone efflux protein
LLDAVLALIWATALLLGSPGPAPIALAATGATYGTRQGLPFLFGILAGLSFAIVGASAGLATLFTAFPDIKVACQFIGAGYIFYIAIKIAKAPTALATANVDAPRFRDGFVLNLLNPKAYAAFLAIFSQFLIPSSSTLASYLITAVVCFTVAVIVDFVWLLFGGILKPVFSHPLHARILRIILAVGMVSAVLYSLL